MVTEETTPGPERERRSPSPLAGALFRAAACALVAGLVLIACKQEKPSQPRSTPMKEPKRLQAKGPFGWSTSHT